MSANNDGEDRVNMVPMIDTMLFLILFFMLVTKFTPDEKAIASVLPTDKGTGTGHVSALPPPQINIAIFPAGMERGFQPSDYDHQVATLEQAGQLNQTVLVRVGGSDPIVVHGAPLSLATSGSVAMTTEISALHDYINRELALRDAASVERKDLPPVVISCYSGLDWKFALLAYDAVRAHELQAAGHVDARLLDAREVDLAPPRLRNYTAHELGQELYEIIRLL